MRNLLLVISIYAIWGAAQVIAAEELSASDPRYSEIRDGTLLPYYETLQGGEVTLLSRYLSAKRYAVNRVLIEQNTAYPDHLRTYFEGAGFELLRLTEDERSEKVTAFVRIYWPDGRETQAELGLIKDSSNPNDISWKIDRD